MDVEILMVPVRVWKAEPDIHPDAPGRVSADELTIQDSHSYGDELQRWPTIPRYTLEG